MPWPMAPHLYTILCQLLVYVWIQLILLKTENNKKNNFFYCLLLFSTVHWPKITVHGQWAVHNALDLKKKKPKTCKTRTQPHYPNGPLNFESTKWPDETLPNNLEWKILYMVHTPFYNLHLTNIKGKAVILHQGQDRNFNS